jgi:Zn-dependent protease
LIFALVTWSLAVGYFPAQYPAFTQPVTWLLGAVTAVLFALSVLLHELGHAYFAQRDGIPIKGITLFLFGGLAQLSREPDSPGSELKIALAGPAVSFGVAAVFGAFYWPTSSSLPAGLTRHGRTCLMAAAHQPHPGLCSI